MAIRTAAATGVLLLVLLLPGCGEETTNPGIPLCSIALTEVEFGSVEGPEPPKTTVTVLRTIRISNPGTADLRGQVGIRIDSDLPHPPLIRQSPEGTDPFFRVPPGGGFDITLGATVSDSTSQGEHRGTVTLGSPCRSIPFSLTFVAVE